MKHAEGRIELPPVPKPRGQSNIVFGDPKAIRRTSDYPTSGQSRSAGTVGRSAPFLSRRALSLSSLSCALLVGASLCRFLRRVMIGSSLDILHMTSSLRGRPPAVVAPEHPVVRTMKARRGNTVRSPYGVPAAYNAVTPCFYR